MPKSTHRAGRPRAKPKSGTPARRPVQHARPLLDRILDTPHLAHVVPRLQPEVLHRVIQTCGLEDCGELVTLATPDQLARVFDLDLWRGGQPGLDEQFDAARFGVWLEVLMEAGATVAARTLAEMDVNLVIAGVAQHVLVFDAAAGSLAHDGIDCAVGGYRVVARQTDSWDAIVGALSALHAHHPGYFQRVMRGFRSLSNSGFEVDGLHTLLTDREQAMFDLAFGREQRRERQGYSTPAQARAFLQMARQLPLGHDAAPPGNPVASAYFRSIEWTTDGDADSGSRVLPAAPGEPPAPEVVADAVASFVDVLLDASVLTPPPRALLDGAQGPAPRLARMQAHMQFAGERNPAAYALRSQELAYLANTLLAGCAIQARPFTPQEASDAAVAICNLGLENWPPHWLPAKAALPDDFLVGHDLVSVFQVGWTVLHHDVIMYAAEQLIGILTRLRHDDRETQSGLNALRIEMTKHWKAGAPWLARDALDIMTILDMPAWAALLGLIDECPVMHAAIGASRDRRTLAVSASAFEFISENAQIASIRTFFESLPETLRP